jgi:low affinity Fe/Cu permease
MKHDISPLIPAKAGIQKAKDWVPAFAGTSGWCVALSIAVAATVTSSAHAQDVRGLEVCTAEKQMERRTSCLQANVDFLQNLIDRNARDARQKLDAAAKEVAAARNEVATMKASLAALQARLEKLEKPEKNDKPSGDTPKK